MKDIPNVISASPTAGIEKCGSFCNTFTESKVSDKALFNVSQYNLTILYDGDAAGIKAQHSGIDMTLEQGLNLKSIAVPDGEYPVPFGAHKDKLPKVS